MSESCPHTNMNTVIVFLEPIETGHNRRLAISVNCYRCGQPFEFVGVEGPSTKLSEDRQELGLTITAARKGTVQ
jgi:hypothetical protein